MFEIIVSNLGTVYIGEHENQAHQEYSEWVDRSKANHGRAAGESVTLMHAGDIVKEYFGTLEQAEGEHQEESYTIGDTIRTHDIEGRQTMKRFKMTEDALANYGEQWRDVLLIADHESRAYMPYAEWLSKGMPAGFHPGYDESAGGMPLYELKRADNGERLPFSLYQWELERA